MDPVFDELTKLLPVKYVVYPTAAWLLIQTLGRAWTAITRQGGFLDSLMSRGGLVGIWKAMVFGSSTATKKDDKQ